MSTESRCQFFLWYAANSLALNFEIFFFLRVTKIEFTIFANRVMQRIEIENANCRIAETKYGTRSK